MFWVPRDYTQLMKKLRQVKMLRVDGVWVSLNDAAWIVQSLAEPSLGSVFSFSGEYSYLRFNGTDCSMDTGVSP